MNNKFENVYVLNILADDRPGIIAGVSQAASSLEGNIDSCSQTVLGGYFTLIMIVSFSAKQDCDQLSKTVGQYCNLEAGKNVTAIEFDPVVQQSLQQAGQAEFVLTAFGKDHPGIVHAISGYLSGKDVNITGLDWERRGDDFALVSQLTIPDQRDICMLRADLEEIGTEHGFTIRLQHENIFVATNQLRLTSKDKKC